MYKILKIGILTRDIEKLKNWELRIVNEIINHPNLELKLFIKDGRRLKKPLGNRSRKYLFKPKNLSDILFAIQWKIESKIFKIRETIDINDIINKTTNVETIFISPLRKGFLDIFSKEDSDKIKNYDLDIILRHEFNIIKGDILNSAKYGIWSFHHGDNSINRGGPAGFWEIVDSKYYSYCGVTLQRLTPELDGGLIIDKAYFNRHWSFYKNNNDLLEGSVVLLFKNINKLLELNKLEFKKSLTYYNQLYKKPNLKFVAIYLIKFYSEIFTRIVNHIFVSIFKIKYNCWSIFFSKGIFLESSLYKINPQSIPSNEFWADPFLYSYRDNLYIFFENYSYKTKKGKISVGKVVNGIIIDVEDILDLNYHLSYPHIIEEDNELFLIPETGSNKRLEVYRCIKFPNSWELYSTKFDGETIADITYFQDNNNERWLFLNKGFVNCNSELYIYKIDNLKLEKIESHTLNPIYIDCRKARNGGGIFELENSYYRPNQINIHGIYGWGLQISRIKKLTLNEYEEEPVISIEPNFRKGLCAIHHLHQIDGYFVFDACFKRHP
jgi:hypothetical protein